MKTKISLLIILLSTCLGFSQKNIAGNYGYKTECLGVELDGSETVKAWGNGRNRSDAVEQAKKNALRDVIFFGLVEGKQDCKQKPLILEVNALEKYEDYFNKFFADGGDFKNYISLRDERIFDKVSRDRKKARESVTNGLILHVLRSELNQTLIAYGIIKQQ